MNHYEAMYIIDAIVDDAARKDLIDRFSSLVEQNGGSVTRIDEWGKRQLAYAINYKTVGHYILMYFDGPSALPRELERNLQISDMILRYLVIRNDGNLPAKREFHAPIAAQPVADAPAAEAPVAETPVPEAPVAEAPVAEAAPEAPAAE